MHQSRIHRYVYHSIIPPYILQSIIINGMPEQRERALQNLGISHSVRTIRAIKSALPVRKMHGVASPLTPPHAQQTIYDAHNTLRLPGRVIRVEGQAPVGDITVNEAYDGLGATFDFYWNVYQRNSINDQGMPLLATVHYGKAYDNAFWNGSQMVFGDGDGYFFRMLKNSSV